MEYEIHSVGEYIEKCFSNPVLKKYDKQVFYRGVNKIYRETPYIPSIYYNPGLIEKEDIIFKEALSFFPEELLDDVKQKILEELSILNINESFVYPDYEHVSAYLRKRYTKQ